MKTESKLQLSYDIIAKNFKEDAHLILLLLKV
jgi:hypothetical protein